MSPKRIRDRWSKLESRQDRYSHRNVDKGLCARCTAKRSEKSDVLCDVCLEKHRKQVERWRKDCSRFTKPTAQTS